MIELGPRIADVPTIDEVHEVTVDEVMLNRQAAVVWFEVALGYVRLMLGLVRQHVIPRTVLRWPRTSNGFVPLLGSLKVRIDIDDHTSVLEQLMPYHVSNRETGIWHHDHGFTSEVGLPRDLIRTKLMCDLDAKSSLLYAPRGRRARHCPIRFGSFSHSARKRRGLLPDRRPCPITRQSPRTAQEL